MKHTTLEIIRDEHQALAAMLRSMPLLLAQARRDERMPDFALLRAMLFYVDEFPERLHHPKETDLLFPKVAEHCPELRPVIDRLDREHKAGELAIRDLEHQLLAFEVMGEPRRENCEKAVERYVAFYLEHMGIEENQILPAARQHLTGDDWAEIDAAFAANRDPLTGHEPDDEYRPLFTRILMHAPAPIGLGPALGPG